MTLAPGCYTIELFDTGNDGLEWWANAAQGAGAFRIRNVSDGAFLKNFETDFGSEIRYSFVVDNFTYIKEKGPKFNFDVYPNPTTGEVFIDIDLENNSTVNIEITDISGKIIRTKTITDILNSSISFDLSNERSGVYFCKILTNTKTITKKIILTK